MHFNVFKGFQIGEKVREKLELYCFFLYIFLLFFVFMYKIKL